MRSTQPAGEHADPAAMATMKAEPLMRPGIIIAIIAAAAVLIGGVIWYNNSQAGHARLEQQQADQAAEIAREEDAAREEQADREEERARQQEDAADAEQAEWDASEAERVEDETTAAAQEEPAIADGDLIVIGDEITEDTIVVQSSTDAPTILDADSTETSVEIISDEEPAATVDSTGSVETDETAVAATPTAPDQLLTPENFERDEVLALIDSSEELSADDRSSLRAMVDGASSNPAMIASTINSIRTALDLPALN